MTSEIKTKRLKDVLSRLRAVKTLAEASTKLTHQDRLLKSVLPSLLSDYCRVQSCSSGELTIEAYSQAVATHLRFSTPKLLEKLRKHDEMRHLQSITVRVGVPPQSTTPTKKATPARPNTVSDANCELLNATADTLSTPDLRDALKRLAATLKKQNRKAKL